MISSRLTGRWTPTRLVGKLWYGHSTSLTRTDGGLIGRSMRSVEIALEPSIFMRSVASAAASGHPVLDALIKRPSVVFVGVVLGPRRACEIALLTLRPTTGPMGGRCALGDAPLLFDVSRMCLRRHELFLYSMRMPRGGPPSRCQSLCLDSHHSKLWLLRPIHLLSRPDIPSGNGT